MSEHRKSRSKAAFKTSMRLTAVLLPLALLAAGVNTYVATRVALTPEDTLRMTQEAEENVSQFEGALDGTPQGWQKLMLTAKKLYELGGLAPPALIRLASSKKANPIIRKMAIEIVRDLKDRRAVGPFTKIARDKANPPGVRDNAVYSLGHIGTAEALDSLLVFLASDELLLKEGALSGIRAFPTGEEIGRAYQPVAELAVWSDNRGVREKAILALSAFADQAVPLLKELVQSDD